MKGITFKFSTDKTVLKAIHDISSYGERAQRAIKQVIANGTRAIHAEAVKRAPLGRTGALKRGIKYSINGAGGEVVSTAPHSRVVEFGTGPRIVYSDVKRGTKHAMKLPDGRFVKGDIYNGKMEKHPFMLPAMMAKRDEIEAEIERAIK